MKIFQKVTTCGEFENLGMRASYDNGETIFTPKRRGLYADFTPTKFSVTDGVTLHEVCIDWRAPKRSGKCFFVRPMQRNSKKTVAALDAYLDKNKEELAMMYDADDWDGMVALLAKFNEGHN